MCARSLPGQADARPIVAKVHLGREGWAIGRASKKSTVVNAIIPERLIYEVNVRRKKPVRIDISLKRGWTLRQSRRRRGWGDEDGGRTTGQAKVNFITIGLNLPQKCRSRGRLNR